MNSTGNSKYLGKKFEDFVCVGYGLDFNYKKQYGNESKPTDHRYYKYNLYRQSDGLILELSGNQMRLLNNGSRTISQMLSSTARGSKNKQINEYKKRNK